MFLVKLLLISVAGHYILRHIGLPAVSGKWPGLPKPLSYKERWHAAGVTERLYKDEPALCSKARPFTPYYASGV